MSDASNPRRLPPRANLAQLKKQAKELRAAAQNGDSAALDRFGRAMPNRRLSTPFRLADAQFVLAREYGLASWTDLKAAVEASTRLASAHTLQGESETPAWEEATAEVLRLLCSDRYAEAGSSLSAMGSLLESDPFLGLALGKPDVVERRLAEDPGWATRRGGPLEREPLLYVCFSRCLRPSDRSAQPSFESAADQDERAERLADLVERLLRAGADPNSFFTVNDDPNARQTALYGAAGVANHPRATRALLDAGADPNDQAPGLGPESLYHAAEFANTQCLEAVLAAEPHADKVSYCLSRALDFENEDAVRLFLTHGADPNFVRSGDGLERSRVHGAIERGRSGAILELLLEAGGRWDQPDLRGTTPYDLAVRLGRTALVRILQNRGADPTALSAVDRFLGACARTDAHSLGYLTTEEPNLREQLKSLDASALSNAAETGNTLALQWMLEAGIDPKRNARGMTPLHWACWHGHVGAARVLVQAGAPLEIVNPYGDTVLGMTVYAYSLPENAARKTAYREIVTFLCQAGASLACLPNKLRNEELEEIVAPYRTTSARRADRSVDPKPRDEDVRNSPTKSFGQSEEDNRGALVRSELASLAQSLIRLHRSGAEEMTLPVRNYHPQFIGRSRKEILFGEFTEADAQLTAAREHGYSSWAAAESSDDRLDPLFEQAADFVVAGNTTELQSLLKAHPRLVTARSGFGHRATLVHYVAANGVELRRQRSPQNGVEILETLLEHGADPEATCETYGGGPAQTPLNLLVSSGHPAAAGTQAALAMTLVRFGAQPDGADGKGTPLRTALAFGFLETARALDSSGADVDHVVLAAGLGDESAVESFFVQTGQLRDDMTTYTTPFGATLRGPDRVLGEAFFQACRFDHRTVAARLLEHGAPIDARGPQEFTSLHQAAWDGRDETAEFLLARGASLEAKQAYGGTVLDTIVWAHQHAKTGVEYLPWIDRLLAAGANPFAVDPFPTGNGDIDERIRRAQSRFR